VFTFCACVDHTNDKSPSDMTVTGFFLAHLSNFGVLPLLEQVKLGTSSLVVLLIMASAHLSVTSPNRGLHGFFMITWPVFIRNAADSDSCRGTLLENHRQPIKCTIINSVE